MVYTDYTRPVELTTKRSNLKWNHKPQASGLTSKFSTVCHHSQVLELYRPWKISSIVFYNNVAISGEIPWKIALEK